MDSPVSPTHNHPQSLSPRRVWITVIISACLVALPFQAKAPDKPPTPKLETLCEGLMVGLGIGMVVVLGGVCVYKCAISTNFPPSWAKPPWYLFRTNTVTVTNIVYVTNSIPAEVFQTPDTPYQGMFLTTLQHGDTADLDHREYLAAWLQNGQISATVHYDENFNATETNAGATFTLPTGSRSHFYAFTP